MSIGKKTVIITGIRITDTSPKGLVTAKLSPEDVAAGVELWGVTRCNVKFWKGALHDWDRWFDLHPIASRGEWQGIWQRRPDAWAWYAAQTSERPIYLQAHHPHVPASVAFPYLELQQQFGVLENITTGMEPNRVFTCMVDWMIAYAISLGFKRIVLNGIGVNASLEHQILHKGIMYWMGFVRGMGHVTGGDYEFIVDEPSTFQMPAKVYAYEEFKYEELRGFRRELSEAQRRAAGGRRSRPRRVAQ